MVWPSIYISSNGDAVKLVAEQHENTLYFPAPVSIVLSYMKKRY
jgi:hypothetical protein